jgi:NAD-dependent dihydropyrimidine dehydrogenase PreA subunit
VTQVPTPKTRTEEQRVDDDRLHDVELIEAQAGLDRRLAAVGRRVTLDLDLCSSCGRCVEICPTDVFRMNDRHPVAAYESDCTVCFLCQDDCPESAITINTAMSARGFQSLYETLLIDTGSAPPAADG